MDQKPTAEVVLAWMREHGATHAATAIHWGVPLGTIKTWTYKAQKIDGPVLVVTAGGKAKAAKPPPAPKPPAVTREPSEPAPPKRPMANGPGRLPASQLGADLRIRLRESVQLAAEFMASDSKDWKAKADAARCTDILLARTPDLMTFAERTEEPAPIQAEAALDTPEGEELLLTRLARLPPHLLEAALARRAE